MRLLLVRHGQSEWNAGRRLQGQADIALSELGRAQADALAPLVASFAPDRVITSDLKRARETAERLGYPDATPEPGLREIAVGAWEGQGIEDLIRLSADDYHGWRAGSFCPEGGELWGDFCTRTQGAVGRATAEGAKTVLIVCHGGVIRSLLHRLVGIEPRQIMPVSPASLSALRLEKGEARLELYNLRPSGPEFDVAD